MTEATEGQRTCFVVMPITTPPNMAPMYGSDRHFEELLEHVFAPAIEDAGFRPIAPAAKGSEIIEARIVEHLQDADLVLCDISSLNANVFFELGMRTAMGRPVAVVRDIHQKKIPFDTGSLNHKEYNPSLRAPNLKPLRRLITNHILDCVESESNGNSLLRWFGMRTAAANFEPASEEEALLKRMALLLDRVERSGFLDYLEKRKTDIHSAADPSSDPSANTRMPERPLGHLEILPRLITDSDVETGHRSHRGSGLSSDALGPTGRSRARQSPSHAGTSTSAAASRFGTMISRLSKAHPLSQCSTIDPSSHSESDALAKVSVILQIDPISKKYSAPTSGLAELRDELEACLEDLARQACIGQADLHSRLVKVRNQLSMDGGIESLAYEVVFESTA